MKREAYDLPRTGEVARGIAPVPASAGSDPVVAVMLRLRESLAQGWSFATGLADRSPEIYLAGWRQ